MACREDAFVETPQRYFALLEERRPGGKSAALMKDVVANVDDEEILELAAYVASKNPAR